MQWFPEGCLVQAGAAVEGLVRWWIVVVVDSAELRWAVVLAWGLVKNSEQSQAEVAGVQAEARAVGLGGLASQEGDWQEVGLAAEEATTTVTQLPIRFPPL